MRLLIIIMCLFFATQGMTQENLSLQQAQEYGIIHNEKVKNATIDLEIAKRKIRETTGIGLPQLSGSLGFNNFLDIPTTVVPASAFNPLAPEDEIAELQFGTDYTADAGLQLSQIVFSGNYLVGLQAAKAYANTSKVLIEKSEIDVKYDVADAYYTVLMLDNNIGSLNDSYDNLKEMLDRTNILVKEKMIESIQADQLSLSLLQIQDAINKVKSQTEVAKNLLKMQMGMELDKEITLSEKLDAFLDVDYKTNSGFNPEDHISHRILDTQLTLNHLNLKNKKADYLPTVSAFLSHTQNAQRDKFNFFNSDKSWYPTTVWGANIAIPIYSGGMTKAKVNQAELEIIKTENNIKQLDRGLELQMKQAVTNYNNAVTTYNTQKKAIAVAKSILDNTTTKYKLGSVMSLELTQMQSQYLNTTSALNTATYDVVKAIHEMDKLSQQ